MEAAAPPASDAGACAGVHVYPPPQHLLVAPLASNAPRGPNTGGVSRLGFAQVLSGHLCIYVIVRSRTRNHHPTTFILGLVLAEMLRKIRLDIMRHKAER